ncbi:sensor histidine kinase [Homoserinibacter sp. YIM 151385]|uniref:sensor histidine kinase n=1 Tax=Homoserinibacter sp. YIM 151385 TaxID=2985506 RepID=UPI0022F04388|nr:ATP-binding protein [Homoserinibacter sp. YIM 151385]WBU38921.1 ATP-binding protein [Homoserinibacter sp. YIM 151385]
MARGRGWSIAGRAILVQLAAVLVIGGAIALLLVLDARRGADEDAAELSLAICETIAVDPAVLAALDGPDPTAALQPFALGVVAEDRVDFVTIMSPDGIRYTHPDEAEIGRPFRGTIDAAQRGGSITETYTGTLGPSVRAVVPIERDGELLGIVSAGVTTDRVSTQVLPRLPFVALVAVLVVAIGGLAAWLTGREVRRATGRLSGAELQNMVQFYESVLHAVREGVVLTDGTRRILLYNDEAADLLGLPPAPERPQPRTAAELGIEGPVRAILDTGRRAVEEAHSAAGRVLLVNQEAAAPPGGAPGTGGGSAVMTLRDQSELQHLVGELESVRTMTDALRAQAHEHANTLHTIVSLLELGRTAEAVELVASASRAGQQLTDAVLGRVEDPVLAALLLGKSAQAAERGIELRVESAPAASLPLPPAAIVSILGNLLDNAIEAALRGPAPRAVVLRIRDEGGRIGIEIEDSGPGVAPELDPAEGGDPFLAGATSKRGDAAAGGEHGIGLAVVRALVEAEGGEVGFLPGRPTRVLVSLPSGGAP